MSFRQNATAALQLRLPKPNGGPSPHWRRRDVKWASTLVFPRKGYRLIQERPAHVFAISEGDAIIKVAAPHDVGESFYMQLNIEGRPKIPCWAVRRTSVAIYCHFYNELTAESR